MNGNARGKDTLVLGRVIGDVVDMFSPSVEMTITYNAKDISSGCELKPSVVASPPRVDIGGEDMRKFFTLVMTDPDAPSPSNPTQREYVQWMVTDIPGTTSSSFGKEIVGYEAPRPALGIHRYVFTLFRQRGRETVRFVPRSRENFVTRDFAYANELGLPVAALFFNSQKESAPRRRS